MIRDQDGYDFDPRDIFIGRGQQLDHFMFYLHRWKKLIARAAMENNETLIKTIPSPHTPIQGLMVLLYGRGGFGKSTLLRHYHTIVLQENNTPFASKIFASAIVDWENVSESKRRLFTLSTSKDIDALGYFSMLSSQLAGAFKKKVEEFRHYQRAVHNVEEARKQAYQIIESIRGDERFASFRTLAGEGIVMLLRLVPHAGAFFNNQQVAETVKSLVGGGINVTTEQIMQLHTKLRERLGPKLGDYLEPDLKLGLSLGDDLREFAKNFPLLIFFDTYEVIDEGDQLLRIVMGAAGVRVGWIIAGRDNLWAGLDQRLRSKGIEYGYKEVVPSDRGLAIDFNTGGIGPFTPSDLKEYFTEVRKRTPSIPSLSEEDIASIWDVTKGIPLAVRIAAGIYRETAKVTDITESVKGQHDIVDQMVRRYLLHVRDDERDRVKLYGLAMLRRANQSPAISAALGLSHEQAKTGDYEAELSRLHRRYSFIFTEKEEPALHEEVRHFLRLWLLEHRSQPNILAINERLKAAEEQSLQSLETRRQYSTLKARLQDDEWVGIYLDVVEQQFWLDPVEGVRLLLPSMLAAAVYKRDVNKEANQIGTFFAGNIGSPYRTWWTWASQSLIYLHSGNPSSEEQHGLQELEKLIRQQRPTFTPLLSSYRNEIEASLWWRLGEAYSDKDERKALEWYEKALAQLHEEGELKESVARTCWNIAYQLYEEKKSTELMPLLNKAIELKPDYAAAYNSRGIAYGNLNQYEQAIADFTQAITLDPSYATAYYNRGNAYGDLEQYKQAIADFTQTITLDPSYATAYNNRGNAYGDLEQYEQAIADFTQAITFDPDDAFAYNNRGVAYGSLKQYEQAIADFTQAITLNPSYAPAYNNRGLAYLWLRNTTHAQVDFSHSFKLDPTDINAAWMAEWTSMGKERIGREIAAHLEAIAKINPKHYIAHVCRGIAMGLSSRLRLGLDEIERAILLEPEEWDAYFWKGIICAYYYRGQSHERGIMEAIEKALKVDLPPVLLTPLYWLEHDNHVFFIKHVRPLLEQYRV